MCPHYKPQHIKRQIAGLERQLEAVLAAIRDCTDDDAEAALVRKLYAAMNKHQALLDQFRRENLGNESRCQERKDRH
jgi:hypothetical protein